MEENENELIAKMRAEGIKCMQRIHDGYYGMIRRSIASAVFAFLVIVFNQMVAYMIHDRAGRVGIYIFTLILCYQTMKIIQLIIGMHKEQKRVKRAIDELKKGDK